MSAPAFMALVLRDFLGLILLVAAVAKARHFATFSANLVDSFGVPPMASGAASAAVVAVEALLAATLLAHLDPGRLGLAAALCLFSVLTVVVGYQFLTRDSVKCSCFGEAERPVSLHDLARNGLIIAATLAGLAVGGQAGASGLFEQCAAAGVAAIFTVLAIHFHELCSFGFEQDRP